MLKIATFLPKICLNITFVYDNSKVFAMKSAKPKILTFALALLIGISLAGQSNSLLEIDKSETENIGKTTTGINLGASYFSGLGGGSLFSQSLSPYVRHQVSSRFSLFAGAELSMFQFSQQLFPFSPVNTTGPIHNNGFFGTTAFVGGEFKASERISFFGSSWVSYNNMPSLFSASNLEPFSNISKGISMNMEYRVSSSFTIGAGVSFSDRRNPFIMQQGFGSNRNPFGFWPGW